MTNLQVDYVSTTDLVPYENNSRTHSQQQVDQIKRSITEFGFTNPILIDEHNGIIAGHGRLQAAQELDMKLVPTIQLEGLTEVQRKAYVIADNKLALNADWDLDELADQLKTLQNDDYDLSLTGFQLDELDDILNGWSTDMVLPEPKEEDENFTIKVTGPKIEKNDIELMIQRAINESGIEGVKIA